MKYRINYVPVLVFIFVTSACSSLAIPANTPMATLAPDKGRVIGAIGVRSETGIQKVKGVSLYLAPTVKDSDGKEILVGLDRVNSAKTLSDEEGRFVFDNVSPGNYGLVLDVITNAVLLLKPETETEEAIIITVIPEKEVNLGTLLYDSLPLPQMRKTYP